MLPFPTETSFEIQAFLEINEGKSKDKCRYFSNKSFFTFGNAIPKTNAISFPEKSFSFSTDPKTGKPAIIWLCLVISSSKKPIISKDWVKFPIL